MYQHTYHIQGEQGKLKANVLIYIFIRKLISQNRNDSKYNILKSFMKFQMLLI